MANLNKVHLIGRLTKEPEFRSFQNGGRVANFGFCVNNRRKNQQTGEWEDEPVWLDCKAFNRQTGRKLADLVEKFCHKGDQIFIEGHLSFESWNDQAGNKRSAIRIVVDDIQLLGAKKEGGEGGQSSYSNNRKPAAASQPQHQPAAAAQEEYQGGGGEEGDIPF